jgi:ribosomal protein S18 acetylase RimI-like enzyme
VHGLFEAHLTVADADLYARGTTTLLASWEAYARGAPGASVARLRGVAAAIFPHGPERGIYNNAVLEHGLSCAGRADAIAAMEAVYAAAGVTRFAAWVHESDAATRRTLERRGYVVDTTTRAMGMRLDAIRMPRPQLEFARPDWAEYLHLFELPEGLLATADHEAFHLRIARFGCESVAAALAFDDGDDCGIYNVETLEHVRRRGFGTALTALQVHDARARGCETASLQATEMAERVYAAVGFRDLGLIIEYVPGC